MCVLIAAALLSSPLLFQASVAEADGSVGGSAGGHAIWFKGLNPGSPEEEVRMRFERDAYLFVNGGESGLRGTATVLDGPTVG
ncbi:MAG: hypothetical protein AAF658_14695, partial [Myxococcota bacterium]